ncbi:hypothetical protein ABT120_61270 [Nonomuraea angiospora]|uniref:hypothetical protein n=1 Tax=Nonomuraea angiospora TaxID=46172 RepID=UPI0033172E82
MAVVFCNVNAMKAMDASAVARKAHSGHTGAGCQGSRFVGPALAGTSKGRNVVVSGYIDSNVHSNGMPTGGHLSGPPEIKRRQVLGPACQIQRAGAAPAGMLKEVRRIQLE